MLVNRVSHYLDDGVLRWKVEQVEEPDPAPRLVVVPRFRDEFDDDGVPRTARVMLGHHVCSICGEDIDYPDLCPRCADWVGEDVPGADLSNFSDVGF